jgi:hypothetical protein
MLPSVGEWASIWEMSVKFPGAREKLAKTLSGREDRMRRLALRGLSGAILGPLAAGLCVLLLFVVQTDAQTYNCADNGHGPSHCYGQALWEEKPQYFGAYTDILQVPMNCPAGCGGFVETNQAGFVDNEIWLIDTNTAECVANPFGMCWVEAGYFFVEGSRNKQFFWVDARPINKYTFNEHFLGPTDPDGVTDHFMIIKDGRDGPGIFQVWVYNTSLSTLYNGTSTGNPMSGNIVTIGQELAGTNSAFAGTANFTRNLWAVQVLGPEYVFWYNSQTTEGQVGQGKPPFALWTLAPSSPAAPEGGQFTTRCCE